RIMKDYLKQLISEGKTGLSGRGIVREYLQARILQSLQDSGAFLDWAFHGGTALRFLYSIPRYSEDLDFALLDPVRPHRFREHLARLRSTFEAENYSPDLKVNDRKTVVSAFVRFPGLLYELGISPHQNEVISVKVEVDTNPPPGAVTGTTLIKRYVTLNLLHHDKASLFAGKLCAVLMRGYTKGRDLYDLMWYLADRSWPDPNLTFLNAAIFQTGWVGPVITKENWRSIITDRLDKLDWVRAVEDVDPFLERHDDLKLLTRENVLQLLSSGE
ncbi:MAG: nucleotidyl transferase AbiEii/AbiGii toxin family protein, partial [Candidatus Auribacterota bacterium]|nr:nucleotidyl transferase AbiEii/AbiGii toxin family protein [Candidatus Auribacterota bacterium]